MPADSARHSTEFDPSVAGLIACPTCLGDLSIEHSDLVCAKCKCAYPVVDRIPMLVTERKYRSE